ncbi:Endonuclease/exonuclease/phosphatase, partial [Cubamyces lactineus]
MLKRTSVRLGTINMNGFGVLRADGPENKWRTMYRMIKSNSIGILLVQETHLTPERRESISKMFKGRIKILYSAHPSAPTRKEGVAVILNKSQINTSDVSMTEIVPGRAMQVTVKCHGDDLNVLCMYAPTADGVEERKRFFQKVKAEYDARPGLARPTLMAGDFNNTEDAIDRLPVSNPDTSLPDLDELKTSLGLMMTDGWRATHPTERAYTFYRGTGEGATCSRLDRIYVSDDTFTRARDWQIKPPAFKTDHSLVTVQLSMADAPTVGKGRPNFPLHLNKDKHLSKQLKTRGIKAQKELEALETRGGRSEEYNPQTILSKLKSDWLEMARTRERELVPRLIQEIKDLQRERQHIQNSVNEEESTRADRIARLTKRITDLEIRRTLQQQANSRARHRIDGERPTKYWSKLHKPCAPRDLIHAFERPHNPGNDAGTIYETDSVKMAEMARNHHDHVQLDEEGVPPPEEREECIKVALESLDVGLSDEQAEQMAAAITYEECEIALKFSKSGTAPGRDGIPYDLWKTLHARFVEDRRHEGRESFDVVKILHHALRDVQEHGVAPGVPFAEGWMAPIYKEKGEKTKIANYRPITLLNTDYKLLTKLLSIRL